MLTRQSFFIVLLVFLLFAPISFVGVVYAHGDEEHATLPSEVNVCHSLSEVEGGACYTSLCEGGVSEECAEDIIDAAISGSGPKFANAVLTDLVEHSSFDVDAYIYAQRIGRTLAQEYDSTGEVMFMECVSDFQYGCSYGFFDEVVSSNSLTSSEMVDMVIEVCSFSSDILTQNMCYHRVGHVFMKYGNHILTPALSLCDALPPQFQSHCWDGVFMEHVQFFLNKGDDFADGGFVRGDILSPCNTIDEQYRLSCYSNHGPYILAFYDRDSFYDPVEVCFDTEGYFDACEHSILDASSGVEDHHMHDYTIGVDNTVGDTAVAGDSRSWLRKVLDFIVSLFVGDGEEGFGDVGSTVTSDALTEAEAAALQYYQSTNGVRDGYLMLSHSFPDGVIPDDAEYAAVVVYKDGQYVPSEVRVAVGQQVLWVNEDQVFWPAANLHPTHKQYPGSSITKCGTDERSVIFDACEAMGPGAAYAFTFNEVGEWKFHDHINPQVAGMVIVSE